MSLAPTSRSRIEQAFAWGLPFDVIASQEKCRLSEVRRMWLLMNDDEEIPYPTGDSKWIRTDVREMIWGNKTGRPGADNTRPALTPEPSTPEPRL